MCAEAGCELVQLSDVLLLVLICAVTRARGAAASGSRAARSAGLGGPPGHHTSLSVQCCMFRAVREGIAGRASTRVSEMSSVLSFGQHTDSSSSVANPTPVFHRLRVDRLER